MNNVKWERARKLSRFSPESQSEQIKIQAILDYIDRLVKYSGSQELQERYSLILKESSLRADHVGESLVPAVVKSLSPYFLDGYFSVPKVLLGEAEEERG